MFWLLPTIPGILTPSPAYLQGNAPSRGDAARLRSLLSLITKGDVNKATQFVMASPHALEATFAPGLVHGGLTPLQAAAAEGSLPIVAAFIRCGAVPTQRNRRNETALFHAVKSRSLRVVLALLKAYGTDDINARSSNGDTALLAAVRNDCPEIVEALVDAGADVNVVNSKLRSPLHLACFTQREDAMVWVRGWLRMAPVVFLSPCLLLCASLLFCAARF